jgi:hypothetical protein
MDDNKLKSSALAWMYHLEVLNDPIVQTNLKENILLADRRIKDCEVLVIQDYKSILIYLKINSFWKFFSAKIIETKVQLVISRLLPNYRLRIVTDKSILDLSLKKVRDFYGESTKEKSNSGSNSTES